MLPDYIIQINMQSKQNVFIAQNLLIKVWQFAY